MQSLKVNMKSYSLNEWNDKMTKKEKDLHTDSDLWSLDHTLSELILPLLKRFKAMKRHAYPVTELVEIGVDDEKAMAKKWESVLDEMIEGFESHLSGDDLDQERNLKVKKGLQLFADYYQDLWD